MIYDYYCVECGRELKGAEIAFDLAEMLKLELGSRRLGMIRSEDLAQLLKPSADLYSDGRHEVNISLDQFLEVLCRNAIESKSDASRSREDREAEVAAELKKMREAGYEKLEDSLKLWINSYGNQAEEGKELRKALNSITGRFQPDFIQKDAEQEKVRADGRLKEAAKKRKEAEDRAAKANSEAERIKNEALSEDGGVTGEEREQILLAAQKELNDAQKTVEAAKRKEEKIRREAANVTANQLSHYKAFLCIEPEFFEEEGNKNDHRIYTLRYSLEKDAANLHGMEEPAEFRGYCPCCGARVLKGTGKYPHRLVGLLGAQSAGKTSMIVSLLDDVKNHYDDYGLEFPGNFLCDDKYNAISWNLKLFQAGYAPRKTPVKAGRNTFNASVLLAADGHSDNPMRRQVVTFIDIAGELCYDWERKQWRPGAMEEFPLIRHCDVYFLCSCIDENAYGEISEQGSGKRIDQDALLAISTGLYEKLKTNKEYRREPKLPPLCIVATKADLTGEPVGADRKTPFDGILGEKDAFFHRGQVEKLRDLYKSAQSESIRRPLEWYEKTYQMMSKKTYVSMMTCSALGGTRQQYKEAADSREEANIRDEPGRNAVGSSMEEEDMEMVLSRLLKQEIIPNPETYLDPMGMELIWRWLFEVIGMKPVPEEADTETGLFSEQPWYLHDIPDLNDYYRTEKTRTDGKRRVFDISEAIKRVRAVRWLFLNSSEHDEALLTEYTAAEVKASRRVLFFRPLNAENKVLQALEAFVDGWA